MKRIIALIIIISVCVVFSSCEIYIPTNGKRQTTLEPEETETTNITTPVSEVPSPAASVKSDLGNEISPYREFACSYLFKSGYYTNEDGRPMFSSGCAEILENIPSLKIKEAFEITSLTGVASEYLTVYDSEGNRIVSENVTPLNVGKTLGEGEHIVSFQVTSSVSEFYITDVFYVKLIIG